MKIKCHVCGREIDPPFPGATRARCNECALGAGGQLSRVPGSAPAATAAPVVAEPPVMTPAVVAPAPTADPPATDANTSILTALKRWFARQ